MGGSAGTSAPGPEACSVALNGMRGGGKDGRYRYVYSDFPQPRLLARLRIADSGVYRSAAVYTKH